MRIVNAISCGGSTIIFGSLFGNAARPPEFHPERAIGRHGTSAARPENHCSVRPEAERSHRQERVPITFLLPFCFARYDPVRRGHIARNSRAGKLLGECWRE